MSYQRLDNKEQASSSSEATPPYSSSASFEEQSHPFYEHSTKQASKHRLAKAAGASTVVALALFGVFSMGRMYENYSFHNAMLVVQENQQFHGAHHGPPSQGMHHHDDKWWMKFHEGESPEEAERKHKEWVANHSRKGGKKDDKWWMKFHKGETPEEAEKAQGVDQKPPWESQGTRFHPWW